MGNGGIACRGACGLLSPEKAREIQTEKPALQKGTCVARFFSPAEFEQCEENQGFNLVQKRKRGGGKEDGAVEPKEMVWRRCDC